MSKRLIEAALFIAEEPLSLVKLSHLVNLSTKKVKKLLEELKKEYSDRGIEIVETEKGYEMRVRKEYLSKVKDLTSYRDLTRGVLRTLAVIAYYQPIKQSKVVKIRGNRAYEQVRELIDKGLVRAKPSGRTKLLETTQYFKDYFDLEELKFKDIE